MKTKAKRLKRLPYHVSVYMRTVSSVVSDSVQPYGLQTPSPQLLCPWGLSRQEYWSGLPCPPPGDLPDPRIKLAFLMPPALAGGVLRH